MATRVPDSIQGLHGLKRRKAVHEWRIDVHRQRRFWGLVALLALLVAGVLIAIPPLLLGIALGSTATYAIMHDHKIGFHKSLLDEIDD